MGEFLSAPYILCGFFTLPLRSLMACFDALLNIPIHLHKHIAKPYLARYIQRVRFVVQTGFAKNFNDKFLSFKI